MYAWTYDVSAGAVVHVHTMLTLFVLMLVPIQKTAVLRHLYACVQMAQIN